MPHADDPLLPSILDRLLDHAPDVSTEPAWSWTQDVGEMKASVMRDLEALLNTRQTRSDLMRDAPDAEIAQSVLTYGLPDLTSVGAASPEAREALRWAVEEAIRRFEPRLMDVRVSASDVEDAFDRTLRLTVEAWLAMDPEPVPVVFDTVVESSTGAYQVKAGS
ncbi:MAG TPA: type VI secretion system baseplate subunit TssE [Pirellulales bacterium]|jgi:type VI secretion system protein ImpF|nr:type VI secretion system baseplate subunit TssE [Pirellulales bacterium]